MKVVKEVFLHLEEVLGCLFTILFVSLTFLNVILRYMFGFIIPWAEEAILIAFAWSVFLGSATAFRFDRHIAIDVVFNKFPEKVQKVGHVCIDLLVLVLSLYMTYLSVILCMHVGRKSTFVMRLSYYWIDLMLVVSFALMAMFGLYKLYLRYVGRYQDIDNVTKATQSMGGEN